MIQSATTTFFTVEKALVRIRPVRRRAAGVTTVEYGIIITLLTATAFAVFPALKPLWGNRWKLESSSGENQATLSGDLGVNKPSGAAAPSAAPAPAAPAPYVAPFSVLASGTLQYTGPAAPKISILGSAIQYGAGGPEVPVRLQMKVNGGAPQTIFYGKGSQVTPASGSQLNSLPSGTRIDFTGTSYNPSTGATLYTKSTSTSNPMIIPLRNGDYVPNKTPFSQQPAIKSFLQGVIDPNTQKVTIGQNEVLYLMELGTNNTSSPAADFQDLVFKVTF